MIVELDIKEVDDINHIIGCLSGLNDNINELLKKGYMISLKELKERYPLCLNSNVDIKDYSKIWMYKRGRRFKMELIGVQSSTTPGNAKYIFEISKPTHDLVLSVINETLKSYYKEE